MSNKTKNTAQTSNEQKDLLSNLDAFLSKRKKLIFFISIAATLIFSLMLFSHTVSPGGDDSAYIIRSFHFLKEFTFPTFQGPLYPIILSPFVAIFGVNIVPLKALSLIFILGHLYFLHLTFKDKIPATIHTITLIIISFSASYLYFASQTYVEAFYLLVQSIGVWYFVKYFIDSEEGKFNLKSDYKKYLYLGLIILLMGLTRSVGYAMFGVVLVYFILYKNWSSILPTIGSFGIFYFLYSFLKKIIWGVSGADFSGQGQGLLYKNYYNHAEGKEDLAGFIQRFWDNSNLYLSKHFYVFLGVRDSVPGMKIMPWLTILTFLLFIVAIIFALKKNKHIFFASIYVGVFCFVTFIMVQKSWDQVRLVIPYFPMIVMSLFSGIFFLLKNKHLKKIQIIIPAIFIIIFFSSFINTSEKAKENSKLKGPWYGQTPDWVNYIKCCKWADKNIPKDAKIASRKPSISFINTKGREFVGIYRFNTLNTKDVFTGLEDSTHLVIPYDGFSNNAINPQIQMYLRQKIDYLLNDNGKLIGVFKPDPKQYDYLVQILKQSNVEFSVSPKRFYQNYNTISKDNYTISPDELLGVLQNSDVEYIVKASLRINPYQKTDRTINTIARYQIFIEQKYPGIFEKVVQIGNDNDEPAILYRINYQKYGLEK